FSCSFLSLFPPPATSASYTLSLHDALPISFRRPRGRCGAPRPLPRLTPVATNVYMEALSPTMEEGRVVKWHKRDGDPVKTGETLDRKSTRLNSSHVAISYAVFCLKKKKQKK